MGRGPIRRTTSRIFTFLDLSPTAANTAMRRLTSETNCINMSTLLINKCQTIEINSCTMSGLEREWHSKVWPHEFCGCAGGDFSEIREPADLDKFLAKDEENKKYVCSICQIFSHRGRTNVRNHVESRHFLGCFSYNCNNCGKILNSRRALEVHKSAKTCIPL